jgi:hypothetical protein
MAETIIASGKEASYRWTIGKRRFEGGEPARRGETVGQLGPTVSSTCQVEYRATATWLIPYGREMNVSALEGSVPLLHTFPVAGTSAEFSIMVRSTRTIWVAPSFTSRAMASPPLGLW